MLIDLEDLAGEIASKVDGAGLTPDKVEHARRRLATEISSGSISAAGMPKRNLVLS